MNNRCTCPHCQNKQTKFRADTAIARNGLPIISVTTKRLSQLNQAICYLNDIMPHCSSDEAIAAMEYRIDKLMIERVQLEALYS